MKINRIAWAALAGALALGPAEHRAHGQIYRSVSNPYSQPVGGGRLFTTGSSNGYAQTSPKVFSGIVWNGFIWNGYPFTNGNLLPGLARSNSYKGGIATNFIKPTGSSYMSGNAGSYQRPSINPVGVSEYVPSDTPKKAFDRWIQDRDRPGGGNEKQKKLEALHKALSNPAPSEIASGAALNAVVEGMEPVAEKLRALPPTAIDEAFLKRLTFTHGSANIGLLRQEGKISWPALLQNLAPQEETAKVRQRIEASFQEVFNQVAAGKGADKDALKGLLKAIDQLGDMASARAQSMTFSENVEVKRHLKSLEDSVAFLKQPAAGDWLPGKLKAKPTSLQELVLLLQNKGIRFAPASAGNETAYAMMQRGLVALYAQAMPREAAANR